MRLEVKLTIEEFNAAIAHYMGLSPEAVQITNTYLWTDERHKKHYSCAFECLIETSSEAAAKRILPPPVTSQEHIPVPTAPDFDDDTSL